MVGLGPLGGNADEYRQPDKCENTPLTRARYTGNLHRLLTRGMRATDATNATVCASGTPYGVQSSRVGLVVWERPCWTPNG